MSIESQYINQNFIQTVWKIEMRAILSCKNCKLSNTFLQILCCDELFSWYIIPP